MVRFTSEWMNIVPLLRVLRDKSRMGSEIQKYIKDSWFEINYCEYVILESVFPKIFHKYNTSFYSYGGENHYYFTQEKLVDSLIRFSDIYEFHEKITHKTKNLFIWNELGMRKILDFVKQEIDIQKIINGFIQYRKDYDHIPENIYLYLSTLIYIHLSHNQEIRDIKKGLIQLDILPTKKFKKAIAVSEKICFNSFSLKEKDQFFGFLRKKFSERRSLKIVYFITKNPKENAKRIAGFRSVFVSNSFTWTWYKIYGPFDFMSIDMSQENLFIIFDDSKIFYEQLSYFRNSGILIKENSGK